MNHKTSRKFGSYFFLFLCLFSSVCFSEVRKIRLVEPTQTLYKWPLIGCDHSIIIGTVNLSYKSQALVHLIPSWVTWQEIECTVYVALSKRLMFQFKLVQQSRQQVIKAYCPSIYTVDIWCFIITHKNQGLFRAGHVKENKGVLTSLR